MPRPAEDRKSKIEQLDLRLGTFIHEHPRQGLLLSLGIVLLGAFVAGLLALVLHP